MTQRERILAIAVGGLLAAVVLQWVFSQYRTAVRTRQNRLASLANEKQLLEAQMLEGALADRQMGEYLSRSLPSNIETARSQYQSWLLETADVAGLADAQVDPMATIPVGDLYQRLGFSVTGQMTLEKLTDLLHLIASHDTLHRIREISFAPQRDGSRLDIKMAIDAIALDAASSSAAPSRDVVSYRVTSDWPQQRMAILNRNFFEPPNQPPRYTGNTSLTATRGRDNEVGLGFTDPENHAIRFDVRSELPDWITFDASRGRLKMNPPEEIDHETPVQFTVLATDSGYPNREVSRTLSVRVVDPPPPPAAPPERPGFDDATQTYLTALVDGKEPQAWIKVRTRGETLKLRVGDAFEIGSVKGTVIQIGNRSVLLEIDGQQFEFSQSQKLSEVQTQ
ncbi:MAG: hypothetical protein AAF539_15945 [Planctomycetota bacterium]